MTHFTVAALYKFAPLENLDDIKNMLDAACKEHKICGTLLIAHEGINGTIASTRAGIDGIMKVIRAIKGLNDLEYKESFAEAQPFYRMKVRIKKEIVTIGMPDVNPNKTVGTYLDPLEWNKVISDPDVIVIDTRNDYEYNIGTFKNAVDPQTKTFREFPDYVQKNLDPQKHKKVAMFCTGGIRCEKASSYMMAQGFENVYHLKGGILKYLETIPADENLWEGECFVFDQRVSVGHGLALGKYQLCPSCRNPLNDDAKKSDKFSEGISCPACFDSLTPERIASSLERQKQIKLAKARGENHIGYRFEGEEG